jgi:hypothetical protein
MVKCYRLPLKPARSSTVRRWANFRICEGFRMPAHHDAARCTGAGVRKPPGKEPAERWARRACRAHLWGFRHFGSGAGSAPMQPGQRSGGVDAPERGVTAMAELARRCPSMLHPQGAHPICSGASAAGVGPAMVTSNRVAAREGHRLHEVSIWITAVGADGRCAGEDPRANRSMRIMRPPQQGQGCVRHVGAVAPAGSAVTVSQGGSRAPSSARARVRLVARPPWAKRP